MLPCDEKNSFRVGRLAIKPAHVSVHPLSQHTRLWSNTEVVHGYLFNPAPVMRHYPPPFVFIQANWNDLYWTTGDGGPQTDPNDSSQNVTNLLGGVIRISVPSFAGAADLYQIPSGNYQGENMGVFPRVYQVQY